MGRLDEKFDETCGGAGSGAKPLKIKNFAKDCVDKISACLIRLLIMLFSK
jgi:hypothetical protein